MPTSIVPRAGIRFHGGKLEKVEEGGWIWTLEARVRVGAMHPRARAELARTLGAPGSEVESVQQWMKGLPDAERRRALGELRAATPWYRPSAADRAA